MTDEDRIDGAVRVHPVHDDALGNASYLVDVGEGAAIAVDPRRDVNAHLALVEDLGLTIVAVLETHLHADFVSGAREIADVTGATIVAPAAADLLFPHRGVRADDELRLGDALVGVIGTPGHTPEHVAYLIRIGDTRLLFSGGSLIVGGAARTDLSGPDRTDALARAQFASLRRLTALPDDTRLYPTHGGGSFCSTGSGTSASSTIGDERATNPLLAIDDEQTFVDELLAGFGSYPRYFLRLREVNRKGAPLLRSLGAARELDPADALRAARDGAWLIDGRGVDTWASAHPEGSVSIELRPSFASWLGWVVPFGEPFVFVLEPDQVTEAVVLARRIGYDRLEGWVRFGAWRDAGLPVSSIETVDAHDAAARTGVVLLDVRQDDEYARDRIPGAEHIELGELIAGKTPDAAEVIAYCGHGERSATAASLLAGRGVRVANLRGGTSGWREAGHPIETGS